MPVRVASYRNPFRWMLLLPLGMKGMLARACLIECGGGEDNDHLLSERANASEAATVVTEYISGGAKNECYVTRGLCLRF